MARPALKSTELDEQTYVVQWCGFFGIPIYHVPNEGKRSPQMGVMLKKAGMRSGVPDLCVPVAKNGYHGLYIEMKVGRNKPTEKQEYWLDLLRRNGYMAVVCWGGDEAVEVIKKYMKGENQT